MNGGIAQNVKPEDQDSTRSSVQHTHIRDGRSHTMTKMIKMRTKSIQDRRLENKRMTEWLEITKTKLPRNRRKLRPSGSRKREGWTSRMRYKNRHMNMYMVGCCTGKKWGTKSTRTHKMQTNKLNNI
eukprot:4571154-Heterocapsa_arctica.AAC.1